MRRASLADAVPPRPASGRERLARTDDPEAEGIIEARLGRPPCDVLEGTVVLEAWGGRSTGDAMSTARGMIDHDAPAALVSGRMDPDEDRERRSVIGECVALVLSIVSIAAWAAPLSRALGAHSAQLSIEIALPCAVALQWGLRSRYLNRRHGLALLASEAWIVLAIAVLLVELPLVLLGEWGRIAAMLVAIWVSGTVLTRRNWSVVYALALAGATVALDRSAPAAIVLGALAGFALLASVAALRTDRGLSDRRPGSASGALLAAVIGGGVGVLLIADTSLGWGVHGVHPAIALAPSVLGSFWGGHHLWSLYETIPRGLSGVPLERANERGMTGPAMHVFLGAILRLAVATAILSAVVVALGGWTAGVDEPSVFVAFACAALASMLFSLLESLSLRWTALAAVAGALAAELICRHVLSLSVAGSALAIGAVAGALLTLPALLMLLSRSGTVLATRLWIR